jgi:tetratricopeptide (TPR) repeat protein
LQNFNYTKNIVLSLLFLIPIYGDDISEIQSEIKKIYSTANTINSLKPSDKETLSALYLKLGRLYRKQGQPLEGVTAFRISHALGNESKLLNLYIGDLYFSMDQFTKAEPFLSQFCQTPSNPQISELCSKRLFKIHKSLGEKKQKISLWDKAIEHFELAKTHAPNNLLRKEIGARIINNRFQKAVYHFSQKHYLESAHLFLDCLTKDTPKSLRKKIEKISAHLFKNTGKHYEKQGDANTAIRFYKAITEYFSKESAVEYAEKRLEQLKPVAESRNQAPAWLMGE